MEKIKLKSITFGYHEGRPDHWSSPKGKTVRTFEAADKLIHELAYHQARGVMGCLKTDIKIEWEDGETYEARYETRDPLERGNTPLANHVPIFPWVLRRHTSPFAYDREVLP